MRSWIVKDIHLTNLVLATTRKEENLWLAHGILRPLKKALLRPRMKAKLLVKKLRNIEKTLEDKKDINKLVPLLNTNSKERQLQDRIMHLGMKTVSMVIAIHVMILVTNPWIVDS